MCQLFVSPNVFVCRIERIDERKKTSYTAYYPLIIMIIDFILIKIYGCYSKIYDLTSFWMCHIQNETFVITLFYRTNEQMNKHDILADKYRLASDEIKMH